MTRCSDADGGSIVWSASVGAVRSTRRVAGGDPSDHTSDSVQREHVEVALGNFASRLVTFDANETQLPSAESAGLTTAALATSTSTSASDEADRNRVSPTRVQESVDRLGRTQLGHDHTPTLG